MVKLDILAAVLETLTAPPYPPAGILPAPSEAVLL